MTDRYNFRWENALSHVIIENRKRFSIDYTMLQRMREPNATEVMIPHGMPSSFYAYWEWYAAHIDRMPHYVELSEVDEDYETFKPALTTGQLPKYTLTRMGVLMHTGNLESVVADNMLVETDVIHFTDTHAKTGERNFVGTIDAHLAMIGAGMGYSTVYINNAALSISDLLMDATGHRNKVDVENRIWNRQLIEKNREWVRHWNKYTHGSQVQNIVSDWTIDELMAKVISNGEFGHVHKCSKLDDGWCGECFQCFLHWVMAYYLDLKASELIEPKDFKIFFRGYEAFMKGQTDDKAYIPFAAFEEKYKVQMSLLEVDLVNYIQHRNETRGLTQNEDAG